MKSQQDYRFWVYILSNRSHILYIGMTNGLRKRVAEHREQKPGTFTARYKITRLVYCEEFQYVNNAIAREKELKHWMRAQKIALIEASNPTWEELMPDDPLITTTNAAWAQYPSATVSVLEESVVWRELMGSCLWKSAL